MKVRRGQSDITERDEQQAVDELRALLAQPGNEGSPSPPDPYWSNLLIRTNQRIDEATSGKALSISWAARVAIPGVIAILSFFIGLHYYYVPDQPKRESSLTAVVLSSPDSAVDSLVSQGLHIEDMVRLASWHDGIFEPTNDQLSEYFLVTGNATEVLEVLSVEQVNDLLARLGARKNSI